MIRTSMQGFVNEDDLDRYLAKYLKEHLSISIKTMNSSCCNSSNICIELRLNDEVISENWFTPKED